MVDDPYKRWCKSRTYEEFVERVYVELVYEMCGKVRRNRRMRGRKSGHMHQIDLTVELTVADLDFLILVECKHYNARVKVDDLLTFAQRIDDIGANKGIVVTTVGYQRGALKVAKGHRIALVTTIPKWKVVRYCTRDGVIEGQMEGGHYIGTQFEPTDRLAGIMPKLLGRADFLDPDENGTWRGALRTIARQ